MRALRAARVFSLGIALTMAVLSSGPTVQSAIANPELHNVSAPVPVTDEIINKRQFQVAKIVIKTKPERVWHVLTDYPNAQYVFQNLKKCHVVEDRGHVKIMEHVVHPSGLPGTFAYKLEVKETPHKALEWHRVDGAFREVDGFWKLEPMDNGHSTVVTYATYINGGMFLPPPLIRRQMRMDMPQVMAALKREAETGSPQIARQLEPGKRNN
jgi:ribosome-associated toxin RatA of RatAB toxin-antitoxin module